MRGLEQVGRQLAVIAPTATTEVAELGVRVQVALTPAPPVPVIFEPMLYLVFQGSKRLILRNGEIVYGPGELVTSAAHIPVLAEVLVASVEMPYRALEIPFDPQLVAALIAELGSLPSTSPEAVSVHSLPEAVLDPVRRLLDLAGDPAGAKILAHGLRREIWYRILTGPVGSAFIELARTNSVLGRVHAVTTWMRRHLDEPLDVSRVAEQANMSVTSLYRLFRAATGASPGSYHKQLRLMEGRRRVAERSDHPEDRRLRGVCEPIAVHA
jgi:AraC-like DNA-binding protein